MSIACDFCRLNAERHDHVLFVAAPGGLVHVCENCVTDCVNTIAAKKAERAAQCVAS